MQVGIPGGFKHCTDFITIVIIIIMMEGLITWCQEGMFRLGWAREEKTNPTDDISRCSAIAR